MTVHVCAKTNSQIWLFPIHKTGNAVLRLNVRDRGKCTVESLVATLVWNYDGGPIRELSSFKVHEWINRMDWSGWQKYLETLGRYETPISHDRVIANNTTIVFSDL